MTVNRFDVGILGSGFGGSLLAAIIARQGMKVLLLDQATHPRFAIGESSTPAADLILDQLARSYDLPELLPLCRFATWREQYPELLCGCKRGFSYLNYDQNGNLKPTPEHSNELLVTANDSREMADTQWYRPDVDAFFSDAARQRGGTILEGFEILWLEKDSEKNWNISITHEGQEETITSEFMIDATGASGFLIEMMGNISSCEGLTTRSSAIFSHWENVGSLETVLLEEGFTIGDYPYPIEQSVIHHLFSDGWFWQIPFEGNLTSLGYVTIEGQFSSESQSPEKQWDRLVARSR